MIIILLIFFAEGGNMIADVVNFVAFKATDANGYPVSFTGSVVDSKANIITDIKTVHDGMGRFTLLPQLGEKYSAKIKFDDGKAATVQLPAAQQGIAMHVDKDSKEIRITLSRASDNAKEKKPLFILGQMENHVAFKTESILDGEFVSVAVSIANFPSGILQITIFDSEGKPLLERLTFINNSEYKITSSLTADTFNVNKRAKNVFTFSIPDTISGSYSVAVTDENKTVRSDDRDNIISRFLLSSDIKGYVHNPAFYFSNDEKFTRDALELVMMTNGWRRFKWEQVLGHQLPEIKYRTLPYIRISGKVYAENKKDIITEGDLNFFLKEKKDGSTSFFTAPIDAQGNFKIDSLVFTDSASLYFNYNTKKKNKKDAWLQLDHTSNWPVNNLPATTIYNLNQNIIVSDSSQMKLAKVRELVKFYNDYTNKIIELKEIKITGKKKSPAQQVNDRYTSALFSSTNAKSVDLINNPIPNGSKLSVLIRDRFPRVEVVGQSGNISIVRGIQTSIIGGRQPVTVYLNEIATDINYIDNLPISEIALIKYVDNFPMAPNNGPAIFVYSKKIEDLANSAGNYINKFSFPGYSFTKEFYSPDYSMLDAKTNVPDVRTTLYWNAEILLDKDKQKETFRFYNSDDCKKMRIIIEGFNNAGKLCRIEKVTGR